MSSKYDLVLNKITIAQYFNNYVKSKDQLKEDEDSKLCCPWHEEDTPSFTYSAKRQLWRCWGACGCGGNVIAMHKKNYGLATDEEAINSLFELLHIDKTDLTLEKSKPRDYNVSDVEYASAYQKALMVAKTVDDWLELDYLMSQHKTHKELASDLLAYYNIRRG